MDKPVLYTVYFSVKPKEEKKEIIIPLIKTNNWKTAITSEKENQLDSIAVQEIIQGL